MITNISTGIEFDSLSQKLKNCGLDLTEYLKPSDENVLIQNGETMCSPDLADPDKIYMLTEGNVVASLGNRTLFYYEPGELIGLEALYGACVVKVQLEFAVRANIYDRDKTLKILQKNKNAFQLYMEYSATQSAMFQLMLGATMASSKRPNFQMKNFQSGENIITQGETDMDVYSLISGKADVLVDEKKVGEIHENEVFGEMSGLTGEPRSATVRASGGCEVMVFGGDDFATLAETNPVALKDIAKSLSERLAHLNQEITKPGS